jgi:hypothetical protein
MPPCPLPESAAEENYAKMSLDGPKTDISERCGLVDLIIVEFFLLILSQPKRCGKTNEYWNG